MLIAGEPGIGKSTLIEGATRLADEKGFSTTSTRCPEQEGAPAFWPWTMALTALAESHAEQIDTLSARTRAILATIVPALVATDDSVKASSSQFELLTAVTELIRSVSNEIPLLITIDDLHWADTSSLKMLEHVVDEIGTSSVLIICAMRDAEFDIGNDLSSTLASLSRHGYSSRLPLSRLGKEETSALLTEWIKDSVSPKLLENIFTYAEGNPFYTLELARLHEQTNPNGRSEHIVVPAGVRDVVSQRLRILNNETRDLLKMASVFGREFDIRLLGAAVGKLPIDTLALLEPAENMDVVQPVESGPTFRFSHALMREVLIASLSLSERVRSHARAADAIEKSNAHPNERHADELAHHYKAAETLIGSEPVVKYLVMAGHGALSRLVLSELSALT